MASRAQCAAPEALAAAQASMATLNKAAAEVLARFPVLACTDVTGFGLAGHAAEMVAGAPCGLRLAVRDLPLLPGVMEYAAMGMVPEGTRRNLNGRLHVVRNAGVLDPVVLDVLFDPQTSGGLLAAVPMASGRGGAGGPGGGRGPGGPGGRDRRPRRHPRDPSMIHFIATFPSTQTALEAERALLGQALPVELVPVPTPDPRRLRLLPAGRGRRRRPETARRLRLLGACGAQALWRVTTGPGGRFFPKGQTL